jgi:DNA polymerase alpha-associated DNA helicase A
MGQVSSVCCKFNTSEYNAVISRRYSWNLIMPWPHDIMHDQICDFPSKTLYGSKLKSHTSVASHLQRDLPNAEASEDDDEVLQHPIVFFDTSGCEYFEKLDGDSDEGSRCNENEGTIVKNWVEKLVHRFIPHQSSSTCSLKVCEQVAAGILPEQIAVITPCA